MVFKSLVSRSPSYLLWFCLLMTFVTTLVDGRRVGGKARPSPRHASVTSSTSPAVMIQKRQLFDDRMKSGSGKSSLETMNPGSKEPNCSVRSSCSTTGSATPRSQNDIRLRNCFCDDVCQSYDDCCHDYTRHQQSSVETIHLQPNVIGCQPLGVEFKDKGDYDRLVRRIKRFTVVNRCPDSYSEPFISAKCDLGNDPDSDMFYRLPVNGKKSKILYLNYYCAICNGNPEVIFWTGHLEGCSQDLPPDDEGPLDRNRTAQLAKNNSDCDVIFDFPDGYWPRPCKKVTRKCSDGWTETRTARECQDRSQTTSYVYGSTGTVFRNKQCAVCNFVNETDTTCEDPSSPTSEGPRYDFPPYSVLVDLNSKALVLELTGSLESQTLVELHQCEIGFVFDPFAFVCRPIYCRKDYVLSDAGCIPSTDSDSEKKFRPRQNRTEWGKDPGTKLDCPQTIRLNQTEYKILENKSVYVDHLGSLYDRDEYELAPPYVFICPPFSGREYNVTVYKELVMFQYDHTQGFLSFVGVIISLMSLLILFVVYMLFPVLRNTPGKCVLCLIASLFTGQLCYLFVGLESPVCFYQAALMHFGYLASFFWTNVLAFDICRAFMSTTTTTLSESGSRSKRFVWFSLYAWISPAVVVAACVTLDVLRLDESFRPHYGEVICWITSQTALLVFFVVPVGAILLVNVVFFVIAIHCICAASRVAEAATSKTHTKGQLVVYIKLSLIMGLTWVFGLFASLSECVVLWYLFIGLNSLQGAFLALVFICTKKVHRQMKIKWSRASSTSTSDQDARKRISSSVNETTLQKEKNKVISKETCM